MAEPGLSFGPGGELGREMAIVPIPRALSHRERGFAAVTADPSGPRRATERLSESGRWSSGARVEPGGLTPRAPLVAFSPWYLTLCAVLSTSVLHRPVFVLLCRSLF